MYLSLPLPSTTSTTRTMTVTVFSTDGTSGPCPYTVNVTQSGYTKTLIDALSNACSLRDDERLLVAEVLPITAYILMPKATIYAMHASLLFDDLHAGLQWFSYPLLGGTF
jgi:hypothetical protein